ncbi:hypothetical protein BDZ97DRAFT_1970090 [Flammula alnicola]|nr:hypothetical protein BDZ97DRAFT_1970090 [Flammula alnicola]
MSVGRDRGLRPWVKGLRAKGDIATFEIPPPFTHCLKGPLEVAGQDQWPSTESLDTKQLGQNDGGQCKKRPELPADWKWCRRRRHSPSSAWNVSAGSWSSAGCSWVEDLRVGGESGSRWGVVERAGRRSPSTSRVHRHQGCIDDEPATLRAHRRHGYIDATGASTKSLRCHGAHRRRGCIDDEPHNVAAASTLGCIAMTPRCHWYFDDDGTAAGASTTTPRRHGLNDDGDAATAGALMMIQQR